VFVVDRTASENIFNHVVELYCARADVRMFFDVVLDSSISVPEIRNAFAHQGLSAHQVVDPPGGHGTAITTDGGALLFRQGTSSTGFTCTRTEHDKSCTRFAARLNLPARNHTVPYQDALPDQATDGRSRRA
jgi:hypothetical protein